MYRREEEYFNMCLFYMEVRWSVIFNDTENEIEYVSSISGPSSFSRKRHESTSLITGALTSPTLFPLRWVQIMGKIIGNSSGESINLSSLHPPQNYG